MDLAFHLDQARRFLCLAKAAEDPEVKAELLALAHDSVELAKREAILRPSRPRNP